MLWEAFFDDTLSTLYNTCGQPDFAKKNGSSWLELTFPQRFYKTEVYTSFQKWIKFVQSYSVAIGPKLLSIKNYVIEIMT